MNIQFRFRIAMSLLLVTSFTMALAGQIEQPFSINGYLKQFSKGKVYLTIYTNGKKQIDSSDIIHGKFNIEWRAF